MKTIIITLVLLLTGSLLIAQNSKANTEINPKNYTVFNREVSFENGTAYLNATPDDGVLWLNDFNFKNGTIELDIKGKNAPGQSFVGVAFHGKDNQTFDAVYFRPFNFKNPERKTHAIQYISLPKNGWEYLRTTFPGKYENQMNPVPENAEDWFHARIVVNYPKVKVYVNGSEKPALELDQISDTKQGKVGFWVGNNSEGWFRNLKITESN
jgi:hypothetical protein